MSPKDKVNFVEKTGQVSDKEMIDGHAIESFHDEKDKDKSVAVGGRSVPWYDNWKKTADQSTKAPTTTLTLFLVLPPASTTQKMADQSAKAPTTTLALSPVSPTASMTQRPALIRTMTEMHILSFGW